MRLIHLARRTDRFLPHGVVLNGSPRILILFVNFVDLGCMGRRGSHLGLSQQLALVHFYESVRVDGRHRISRRLHALLLPTERTSRFDRLGVAHVELSLLRRPIFVASSHFLPTGTLLGLLPRFISLCAELVEALLEKLLEVGVFTDVDDPESIGSHVG